MVLAFTIPNNYSWVLLPSVGFGWLNTYQTWNVGRFRKIAGIEYPQLYAEKAEVEKSLDAKKFNCAQRAHQNTLETLPLTLFYILFSGIKYPTAAALLGAAFIVVRIIYTIGYSTGTPAKRRGALGMFPSLALRLLSTWTAIEFVRATL